MAVPVCRYLVESIILATFVFLAQVPPGGNPRSGSPRLGDGNMWHYSTCQGNHFSSRQWLEVVLTCFDKKLTSDLSADLEMEEQRGFVGHKDHTIEGVKTETYL
jgi:hypothetical protein